MLIYKDGPYQVKKSKRDYILINTKGSYENHGHLKRFKTCKKVISLLKREIVPQSKYLRGTVLRVSTNEKYIEKVKIKIEKDKQKQYYFNSQKGVRK